MATQVLAPIVAGRPRRKPEAHVLDALRSWQAPRRLSDCPLPELYRCVRRAAPRMSIGQFQDALRSLYQKHTIYLHPWTGPLYEMPEPALALLAGHEIAYYASLSASETDV